MFLEKLKESYRFQEIVSSSKRPFFGVSSILTKALCFIVGVPKSICQNSLLFSLAFKFAIESDQKNRICS